MEKRCNEMGANNMSTKQVYVYRCDLCGKEKTTDKKLTPLEEFDILRTMQVPARTEGRFELCTVQLCNECANRYTEHVWKKYEIWDEYGFCMKEKNNDKP